MAARKEERTRAYFFGYTDENRVISSLTRRVVTAPLTLAYGAVFSFYCAVSGRTNFYPAGITRVLPDSERSISHSPESIFASFSL